MRLLLSQNCPQYCLYDIACQLLLGSSREVTSCQGLCRALATIQAELSIT